MDLISAPSLSRSVLTRVDSTSGGEPTGIALRSISLACTSGSATISCNARLRLPTMGAGTPAGPKTAFQV